MRGVASRQQAWTVDRGPSAVFRDRRRDRDRVDFDETGRHSTADAGDGAIPAARKELMDRA
jgi:hypothetical protein